MENAQGKDPHKKKRWDYRRRSLSKELSISLALLLIFFQGALLANVYSRQSRLIVQNLATMADDYTRNLRDVLVVPILTLDDEQIGKIGISFLQNGVVDEVHIKNSLGKTLFRAPGGEDMRRHLQRSIDIIHKIQVIGHAVLFFSMSGVEKDLAWLRNAILIALLTSVIVIFITTGILLRIFIRKPLDIPGIDGLETYKRVLQFHPTQKAIIAGGFSESERVREALKLGAGAYVKKPYLMEKMAVTVREELGRKI